MVPVLRRYHWQPTQLSRQCYVPVFPKMLPVLYGRTFVDQLGCRGSVVPISVSPCGRRCCQFYTEEPLTTDSVVESVSYLPVWPKMLPALQTNSHVLSASTLASRSCRKMEAYACWSVLRSVDQSLWHRLFSSSWACNAHTQSVSHASPQIALQRSVVLRNMLGLFWNRFHEENYTGYSCTFWLMKANFANISQKVQASEVQVLHETGSCYDLIANYWLLVINVVLFSRRRRITCYRICAAHNNYCWCRADGSIFLRCRDESSTVIHCRITSTNCRRNDNCPKSLTLTGIPPLHSPYLMHYLLSDWYVHSYVQCLYHCIKYAIIRVTCGYAYIEPARLSLSGLSSRIDTRIDPVWIDFILLTCVSSCN